MNRLYLLWLQFLRYANAIELHGARQAGNMEAVAWCRIRIADLDRQIDNVTLGIGI